jgi:hypothetical protein
MSGLRLKKTGTLAGSVKTEISCWTDLVMVEKRFYKLI